MRAPVIAAVLLACAVAGGCYAWRSVAGVPRGNARVAVRLTGPQTVVTLDTDGDSGASRTAHPGVVELSGSVFAATPDTLTLRLEWMRTGRRDVSQVAGRLALVPAAVIARVSERKFQPVATVLGGLGMAGLAMSVLLLVILTTMFRGF